MRFLAIRTDHTKLWQLRQYGTGKTTDKQNKGTAQSSETLDLLHIDTATQ
jgi:hypothetical protein